MSNDFWKTRYSMPVHKNPWFTVYENGITQHNGKNSKYYVVHAAQAVFVVPIAEDGEVFLIKQYRYPNESTSWEVPAGAIDPNEDSLEAGKRELMEETGIEGGGWEKHGKIYLTPGLVNSVCTIYKASNCKIVNEPAHEDEAILECRKFPESEIKKMIQTGEMNDGPSIAVLSKVLWMT